MFGRIGKITIPEKYEEWWIKKDRSGIRRCIRLYIGRNCEWRLIY